MTGLAARLGYTDKNADGACCAHCGAPLGAADYCPARPALRCSGGDPAPVTVVSAHCTPGGRVRLRLSDGSTCRVPASSTLAGWRKGRQLTPAELAAAGVYVTGRWQ